MARVVIFGWDKLIEQSDNPRRNLSPGKQFFDLKSDPDDRADLAVKNAEKVDRLSGMIDAWIKATPPMNSESRVPH